MELLPQHIRLAGSCALLGILGPGGVGGYLWGVIVSLSFFVLTGDLKWYYYGFKTLPRDIRFMKRAVRALRKTTKAVDENETCVKQFSKIVRRKPNSPAIISADTGDTLTFLQAEQMSKKIANVFHEAGFKDGDSVALLMDNRVEYIPIWLGLSRLRVITALINTNLVGDSLVHGVKAGHCKGIIFSQDFAERVSDIKDKLDEEMKYYNLGSNPPSFAASIDTLLEGASVEDTTPTTEHKVSDRLLYIYTSGTTGLPKAAVVTGARFITAGNVFGQVCDVTEGDVWYNALPLYHSSGGMIAAANLIVNGVPQVVRKRFSASKYFEDCAKYNATIMNYIGEICRYLVLQPAGDFDQRHKVRLAVGNGLKSSVWTTFQSRFNIKQIVEFYGSTEGTAGMANIENRVGAVGFNSLFLGWILPLKIVRVDEVTRDIVRDENGRAILCQPGELGELVGLIKKNEKRIKFEGYVDSNATQKKIATNCLVPGDRYFRTGDIMYADEEGWCYFHDRTGDTFRWKGENVSTSEVEGLISRHLDMTDVVSYGVGIPGMEGKAGMICVADPDHTFDVSGLAKSLSEILPPYAVPAFVRLSPKVHTTGTHKLKKFNLQSEGFDLSKCGQDRLFYLDVTSRQYKTLDHEAFTRIQQQTVRF